MKIRINGMWRLDLTEYRIRDPKPEGEIKHEKEFRSQNHVLSHACLHHRHLQ